MPEEINSMNSFVIFESNPCRLECGWVFFEGAEDRLNRAILKICEDVLFLGLSQAEKALRGEVERHRHTFSVALDTSSFVSVVTTDNFGEVNASRIVVSCNEVYQLAAEQRCSIWTAAANVAAIYVEQLLVTLARELVAADVSEEAWAAVEAELKPRTRSNILKALCSNNFTESHLERRGDNPWPAYPAALLAS